MKNFEKYATIDERTNAFERFCSCKCDKCRLQPYKNTPSGCEFAWLELEEDMILSCPFCGGKAAANLANLCKGLRYWVDCLNKECMYRSAHFSSREEAIATHNRICKAVAAYNKEAPNE